MSLEKNRKHFTEREMVIAELISTEHNYVRFLEMVVKGYMEAMKDPSIEKPENWDDTDENELFFNLKSIYFWHREVFSKELDRCRNNVDELGPVFERNERKMLSMYTKYSHNKPKSEQLAEEFAGYLGTLSRKLGYSQQLNELLFKPIQRITTYHLLVSRIYSITKKLRHVSDGDPLKVALKVVQNLPYNINVMMKFRDLMGYTTDEDGNGKLLFHGRLLCSEGEGLLHKKKAFYHKTEAFMVYLFEKNIFFNVVVGTNKENEPKCYYRNHIPVNNMKFSQFVGHKNTFIVRTMNLEFSQKEDPQTINGERPRGDVVVYICRAETAELYAEWIEALTSTLLEQYKFAGDLENPTRKS